MQSFVAAPFTSIGPRSMLVLFWHFPHTELTLMLLDYVFVDEYNRHKRLKGTVNLCHTSCGP